MIKQPTNRAVLPGDSVTRKPAVGGALRKQATLRDVLGRDPKSKAPRLKTQDFGHKTQD
jgi:hypothetical protein